MRFLLVMMMFPMLVWGSVLSNTSIDPIMPTVYRITQAQVVVENRIVRCYRFLQTANGQFFLAFDEENFQALLLPVFSHLVFTNVFNTLYQSLQHMMKSPLGKLQPSAKGSPLYRVLTTDLCPTMRPMSRVFYEDLENTSMALGKPLPVVVFFSGKWILNHTNDLRYLKERKLALVAGNHSFSHHIYSNSWNREVFIAEITNTERVMLAHGILPSPWFRFPGLKYHPDQLAVLREMNLIPVDTTMWIGQKCSERWAIILAHSNGVKPVEERLLHKFLLENRTALLKGEIVFESLAHYALFVKNENPSSK